MRGTAMAPGIKMLLLMLLWAGPVLGGTNSGITVGREFITVFMENYQVSYSKPNLQLLIYGYAPSTTVTVSVPKSSFRHTVQVQKDQMAKVKIPADVELSGTTKAFSTILVQTDQDVSVMSLTSRDNTGDTSVVYPVKKLGLEYYVITPGGDGLQPYNEFSVAAWQETTEVKIYLRGSVTFQGQDYTAGSLLTVSLTAYEAIQIQSSQDLSGTRVVSSKPVAVLSGHTCTTKNGRCDHVFEQLLPVSTWGRIFFIPPLPFHNGFDLVYVVASQSTNLNILSGGLWKTQDLVAGQIVQLQVSVDKPLGISGSASIQVLLFCSGDSANDPFMAVVPDVSSYCTSYSISGQQGFNNYGLLMAKTTATSSLMVDWKPLQKVSWRAIPGTEYSWGEYRLGTGENVHSVKSSSDPFGLLSVSVIGANGYGTVALCNSVTPIPSCSTTVCRKMETCKMTSNGPECVATSTATGWAWGDPHYKTFDGHYYDFMGTCTYTIAKTCGPDTTLPAFHITAKNDNRGNRHVSYVGFVDVHVYNYTISIVRYEYWNIRVNNQRSNLPISLLGGKIQAYQSGASVVIETDFSLWVSYDWNYYLLVKISSSFAENLCGLLGNYNGNPSDDFTTSAGTLAPSPVEFGGSWKVADGDRFCWDDCNGVCKTCSLDLTNKYKGETFCGWLSKEAGGPFAQCHNIINPRVYVDNCVYDMCMMGGTQEVLCQTLKTYADACQAEGVTLGNWRTLTGCPLPCPANSQYRACGSACPITCNDQAAPKNCNLPCVETCECQAGFVLDAGKCIPQASCGCEFEGRLYSSGEEFWGDRACSQRCLCDPQTRRVSCQEKTCKTGEECRVEKGIQDCYPANFTTCTSIGDPHYITFDGKRFDFQGSCLYQLSGLCKKPGDLVDFQVLVQNDNRGFPTLSFTRAVEVRVYGINITISHEHPGRVLVNGLLTNLPYSTDEDKIIMSRRGQEAAVQADFGLSVTFDWQSRVAVTVPSTYAGMVCGLCGNFNGDQGDDFIMKDGRPAPNPKAFGRSWRALETPGCTEPDVSPCGRHAIVERKQRTLKGECGTILNTDGPFRVCHAKVDPEVYFQDCVYDYCYYGGQLDMMCQIIAAYATTCQAAGVAVDSWRSDLCNPTCPPHAHYELCGTSCPATCHDLPALKCDGPCTEGCFCDVGYVLSGDRCVPEEECGCMHQGRYYSQAETFYTDTSCREQCRCVGKDKLECQKASCGTGQECRVESGIIGCYGERQGRCTMSGNSHYLSFDGQAFDFQGSCTYTLAKVCGGAAGLEDFNVVVENESPKNSHVTLARSVVVSAYGYTITVEKEKRWKVMVNGELYVLPLVLDNGNLWGSQEGNNIIIQAASGLQVFYDTSSYVLVTIPSTYQGHVCGLCGNYNGNKNDDFLLPTGKVTQNMDEFGASWKVPTGAATCSDGCGDRCPICNEAKMAPYKAKTSCGLIKDTSGPFTSCHSLVSPDSYFSHCLYDMCAANGAQDTLCQSLQAYTAACQVVGAQVRAWRSTTFCPLSCPRESKYDPCVRSFLAGCASLSGPTRSTGKCFEGCHCDKDRMFDGENCVSVNICGCVHNGRYIQSMNSILSANCSEECTCYPRGVLSCEAATCSPGVSCSLKNGLRTCT